MNLCLPDEQERVLLRMARRANDDGTGCYLGVSSLAEQTGRSERSVQRVLRVLEDRRLIVPVANRIGGRGHKGEYLVTLPTPVKGDTDDTLSSEETATPVTPIASERVTPTTPIQPERVSPTSPFTPETVTPASSFAAKRVTPVVVKGDTGDTSPSPPITPLSPSGEDPEKIQSTTSTKSSTAPAPADQARILRSLSAEAREILDWHRECHGRRSPAKLTPESARVLEAAVADLGVERLRESVRFMAGKIPPVPELSKALTAARTKRQRDENPGQQPYRNGTHRTAASATPPANSTAGRMKSERY